jgi:hypothetical protein
VKETTGEGFKGGEHVSMLAAAEAKVGKSSFLVASCLGVLPWQVHGGVVSQPKYLHVLALDRDALDGIKQFLALCGAPKDALAFRVYDLQDDVAKASCGKSKYDYSFYNTLAAVRQTIEQRATTEQGVHAVIMSSFTTMARTVERATFGEPGSEKDAWGKGWDALNQQMTTLQNSFQRDRWHMVWEAHVGKGGEDGNKDVLKVHGGAGKDWPNNTSHNMRIRRLQTESFKDKAGRDTGVNKVYLEPKGGGLTFLGGRRLTALDDKEPCLTKALMKMGYRVGRWNNKSKE